MRASAAVNRHFTGRGSALMAASHTATSRVNTSRSARRRDRPAQHADLAFRNVQPASVLGRVVRLKASTQPPGLLGGIDMIPARQLVRVPVVHHQHDLPVRKVNIRQGRRSVTFT